MLIFLGTVALVMVAWYLTNRAGRALRHPHWFPFGARVSQIAGVFDLFFAGRRRVVAVLLLAGVCHAGNFGLYYFAARAQGMDWALADALSLMPVSDVVTMIPVTLSGLGLREVVFQTLLVPLCAVPPAMAVFVSLTGFLFTRRDMCAHFREWRIPFRALGTLIGWRGVPAVLEGLHLWRLLHELVGERRIENCTTARLHLAVTNLRTSRVELRAHGPLVDTMLASCALPGLIAPRRVEGETLWDGGLGCSAPIEQWIDDPEVTHIVVHSILHHVQIRAREQSDHRNFTSAMLAGHQLTADELLHWKIELARRAGKTVSAIETITPRPRIGIPITFWPPKPWPEHARDLMALGAASARRVSG